MNQVSILDWGKVSHEYATHRPPPPLSFFRALQAFDLGVKDQNILDLGTGVGFLALQFARQKAHVVGVDISSGQIEMAKQLAHKESLSIEFQVCSAENIAFSDSQFDAVTAMQCWNYFDRTHLYPRLKRQLKPRGVVMVGNYDQISKDNEILRLTEELMSQYNSEWKPTKWSDEIPSIPEWYSDEIRMKGMFYYDEDIPFTLESWIGRAVASGVIGTVLPQKRIQEFKKDLQNRLRTITTEHFFVPHRLSAYLFEFT